MSESVKEERAPLNPFYKWIGKEQQHLRQIKSMLHPAVFSPPLSVSPPAGERAGA
jgi:hypothetical protein